MARPSRQPIALLSIATDPASPLEVGKINPEAHYLRQLGEALVKVGWQVDLFTLQRSPEQDRIVQHTDHCRTIRLPGPQEHQFLGTPGPESRPGQAPEQWSHFFQAFHRFQVKEGANYPLIHSSDWISGWVALQLQQQNTVQWVHTAYARVQPLDWVTDINAYIGLQTQTEQQIWERADQVVVTSPWQPDSLPWPFTPQHPVKTIPGGTNPQHFHCIPRAEARATLGLSTNQVILLYVGQFAPHKGIDTLVQACAQLKARKIDFQVILAGSDGINGSQEHDRIRQLVNDANLMAQTRFPGHVGHDRLPYYYGAADACIIPSHYEPFGWVAIEAMACGTPVIASNVGGLRLTIAHEETGLLVPPQNSGALAAAIQRVLSDPVWANTLREQSSNHVVQHFSWNRVAAQMSDLYRRLLAQSLMGPGQTTLCPSSTAA
jgi:glycosyltransferase involved in cell wall biosynthesis